MGRAKSTTSLAVNLFSGNALARIVATLLESLPEISLFKLCILTPKERLEPLRKDPDYLWRGILGWMSSRRCLDPR